MTLTFDPVSEHRIRCRGQIERDITDIDDELRRLAALISAPQHKSQFIDDFGTPQSGDRPNDPYVNPLIPDVSVDCPIWSSDCIKECQHEATPRPSSLHKEISGFEHFPDHQRLCVLLPSSEQLQQWAQQQMAQPHQARLLSYRDYYGTRQPVIILKTTLQTRPTTRAPVSGKSIQPANQRIRMLLFLAWIARLAMWAQFLYYMRRMVQDSKLKTRKKLQKHLGAMREDPRNLGSHGFGVAGDFDDEEANARFLCFVRPLTF